MRRWRGRVGNRHGQSIVEYLVVATAIIIAIFAIAGLLAPAVRNIGTNSATQTGTVAPLITGQVTAVAR